MSNRGSLFGSQTGAQSWTIEAENSAYLNELNVKKPLVESV
jgi:hypothetical protein